MISSVKVSKAQDTINRSFEIFKASQLINESKSNETNLTVKCYGDQKRVENAESCSIINKDEKCDLKSRNGKHVLEECWSFWFYKNNPSNEWKDNLVNLGKVEFVEDFWSMYNHLKPARYLSDGCDYMLFKDGIKPMWEDERNSNGGRWFISIDKRCDSINEVNDLWLNAQLSLIGSHYDDVMSYINGVVINVRSKWIRLALWTRCAYDLGVQSKIARLFQKELGLKKDTFLSFEAHSKKL